MCLLICNFETDAQEVTFSQNFAKGRGISLPSVLTCLQPFWVHGITPCCCLSNTETPRGVSWSFPNFEVQKGIRTPPPSKHLCSLTIFRSTGSKKGYTAPCQITLWPADSRTIKVIWIYYLWWYPNSACGGIPILAMMSFDENTTTLECAPLRSRGKLWMSLKSLTDWLEIVRCGMPHWETGFSK